MLCATLFVIVHGKMNYIMWNEYMNTYSNMYYSGISGNMHTVLIWMYFRCFCLSIATQPLFFSICPPQNDASWKIVHCSRFAFLRTPCEQNIPFFRPDTFLPPSMRRLTHMRTLDFITYARRRDSAIYDKCVKRLSSWCCSSAQFFFVSVVPRSQAPKRAHFFSNCSPLEPSKSAWT